MSELAKREDEHVLSGEAGIRQSRFSALAPFRKSHVVELAQILGDDKRRDAVFKALLEEDQSPHHVIGVVCKVDLKTMIQSTGDSAALFRLKNRENI